MTDWARNELERLEEKGGEMQKAMTKDVMEVVEVFANQGHSGASAAYALSIISRLLDYKPITPLTGEDDEWMEAQGGLEQNKRCFAVFRRNGDNATATYQDARVFSDDGGKTWFSSRDSVVKIKFPFAVPDKPERTLLP